MIKLDRSIIKTKLQNRYKTIIDVKNHNAVLMPLFYNSNSSEWLVVFQLRSSTIPTQPGEISLPGGKIEQGETAKQTALRETNEELGILDHHISIWEELDQLITPFNMSISSFAGEIHVPLKDLKINPDEVAEVFTIPLNFFVNNPPKSYDMTVKVKPDRHFPYELVPGRENYQFRTGNYPSYFYIYNDRVIWGFTARIIKNFIDIVFC